MTKTRIAFLHTSPAHIPTFEELLSPQNVQLIHTVEEKWLTEAQSGGLSAPLVNKVSQHLRELAQDADAVVCTCSSIGPIVQALGMSTVFRADQPMMAEAVQHTPVLLVMCLASTETASTDLLIQAFTQAGVDPDFRTLLCHEAWQHFENNNLQLFGQEIAESIKQAIAANQPIGCVVLAQASMAAAQPHLESIGLPVYSSPMPAALRALAIASDRNHG